MYGLLLYTGGFYSRFFIVCAPGWNRTNNNGLEVRSYIHLTTGALTHTEEYSRKGLKMKRLE